VSDVWRGVYAVVYTYNRRELAAQCLEALRRQTVRPERIVFVDNGSTDGTRAFLAARGLLDGLDYVRLEQNSGAAGGLDAGIGHAYRRGCDWAWVMDDDVVPDPDALDELRRAYEENFAGTARVGFLVSQLAAADGRPNNVPQIDDRIVASDRCAEWGELLAKGIVRVRIATLTSILLPRATIERCGTPCRDFFIWGEDTDYTLRITDWRPGWLVGRSRAVHLRGVGGFLDIFNEENPGRQHDFYYLYRNTTYHRRAFWPAHGFALFLGKAFLHFVRALGSPEHGFLRARVIFGGVLAGLVFRPRYQPIREAPPPSAELPPSAAPLGHT
jgi:dTDP-4-dehydrorhamnose reductase